MWIEVTEEHIKNGAPEDECNCPLALAIQDAVEQQFPDDADVEQANVIVTVHDDDINVWHHNNNAEMDHMFTISPKKTEEWDIINTFIKKFDGGGDVEPFNIEVETN